MERIELITRQHLHVQLLTPGKKLQAAIEQDVLSDTSVLQTWEDIACSIPARYEAYSLELPQYVLLEAYLKASAKRIIRGCHLI